MEIGKPRRVIEIEPVSEPVPGPEPAPDPAVEPAPREPAVEPAGRSRPAHAQATADR